MKVLVTGVKGQLGYDVMNELAKRNIEGVGVDIEEMDITDAAAAESGFSPELSWLRWLRWSSSSSVRLIFCT